MSQKLSLLDAFLFQIIGQQVGIHLCFEQGYAGEFGFVNILCGFRVELEGGKDHDFRLGYKVRGFIEREFDLLLFERCKGRAKRNDNPLTPPCLPRWGAGFFGFGVGMEPARARERLDPCKRNALLALCANPCLI